jgi:hypothetical protein
MGYFVKYVLNCDFQINFQVFEIRMTQKDVALYYYVHVHYKKKT